MADHEEIYGEARAERLEALLRSISQQIAAWDHGGRLLDHAPELLRLLGDARSELFHYEVRRTYDTPEVAEHRRLVDEAGRPPDFLTDNDEDDAPWRNPEDR
jgi:PAS domain-containing protein